MMVRILSALPLATGAFCILLVLVGAIGYTSEASSVGVPIPPCAAGSDSSCEVGMNQDNLSVPMPFTLLDVSVSMYWDHGSDAWIGVVDAEKVDWEKCSPNEQGLTGCRASDFDIIAGGPDSTEGMEWSLEPGTTRFITGGRAGTITLDTNIVTYTYSVGLGFWPGAFLAVVGLTLGLAGIQMAFPVKFRKSG